METNAISAAAERKQRLLLGEACLAACSGGWVQHCEMTSLLDILFFFFFSVLAKSRDVQSAQGRIAGRKAWVVLPN